MKHLFALISAAMLFASCVVAQSSLPVAVPRQAWEPLADSFDPDLQQALTTRLNQSDVWRPLIRDKKMAVGIVDLSDPRMPRFAHVNGDHMMYAASLPKIALLYAATRAFEDGKIKETQEVKNELSQMIRVSSNVAATAIIDRLGYQYIASTLTDPNVRLFDPMQGGGLWVGKRYGQSSERYPDPIKGISHAATANQVCRFYYLLATGKLINARRSAQMLDVLVDPGLHHKFVNSLERRAPDARLYRKSGTWGAYHADSVLVWGPTWRHYILVGLVEDENGERILRNLVPAVEDVLHPASTFRPIR